MAIQDLLRERGYRVSLAHDAATAVERLRDSEYHLVLLDMRLPDGDGSQICRFARRSDPATHVVVITGHRAEMEGAVRQLLAEGALAVLHKPFDMATLVATVQQLTAEQQAEPAERS